MAIKSIGTFAATPFGVIGGCLGFIVIGALQALYGPAVPFLLTEFTITTSEAGFLLSAHFVGALFGVLLFNGLMRRMSNRMLLAISYSLMIGGCSIVGFGGFWYELISGAFIIGIGFGGIDFGLNYLFSIGFGCRSVAMVNLLNAFFGVGAVAAPMAIGWFGAEHYAILFSTLGVATFICLVSVAFYSNSTGHTIQTPTDDLNYSEIARNRTMTWLLMAFFIIYIFHVAVETGIGGWAPTHLETVGYDAAFAATTTSGFWLAMTLGRFAAAPLSVWMKPSRIMLIAGAGLTVSVWMAGFTSFAPFAYLMAGVFIAPIFPTGLAWLGELIPESRKATAWVIALSMIGGVAFPPIIGLIIGAFGVHSALIFMGILAFGCFVAAGYINLTVNRTSSDSEIVPENQI